MSEDKIGAHGLFPFCTESAGHIDYPIRQTSSLRSLTARTHMRRAYQAKEVIQEPVSDEANAAQTLTSISQHE